MEHEISLISTIAVGLCFAFVGGFVALRFRLPPLVGYLFAGIAVGPFTPGFIADTTLAPQLAELGVILLMFGVGTHFSFRDLMAVQSVALPGAVAQIVVATAFGMGVAWIWGWTTGAGLVFGLALSVASTVVLLRALEARGITRSRQGQIAVGWLIVEDLVIVLVLVLLPAVAGVLGGTAEGVEAVGGTSLFANFGITLGKVALFVVLMLAFGTRLFPWILRKVEETGSRELFTLAVIALAIGVAFGAWKFFGVSFALAAFFSGVVINASNFSRRASAQLQPLQDFFAVLFFLSVGMLFDPWILVRQPLQVLVIVAIIIFGKSLAAIGIVLVLRHPLNTALTVAAALAQIGEFSFILAGLGVHLGLLCEEGRNLILAGALLSITLNPLVFRMLAFFDSKNSESLAS